MRPRFAAAVTSLLVLGLAAHASAAEPPKGPERDTRVLPAGVESKIEAAFGRAAPGWTLKSAKIDKAAVTAKVCTAEGACHDLTLGDPRPTCAGKTVGPWCLTWKGAAPASAAALEGALAKDADDAIWQTIRARPKQPAAAAPESGTATGDAGAQGAAGGHEGGGQHGGDHGSDGGPGDDGNTTVLLVVALLSAAAATFALFRLRDDEDEEDDEGDEPTPPPSDDPGAP